MMKKLFISLSIMLVTQSVFADMTCGSMVYHAVYDLNTYTCDSGEFLPANTLGCVVCPQNATCPGGTFDFNPTTSQGVSFSSVTGVVNNACADNFAPIWSATYDRNTYDCSPGEYVPANMDGCVICPADSYCPGGTYTFNETMAQGINTCANGLHTPAGMWESDQCGRILHIGENVIYMRSTRKTIPSFNIRVGNDIFYGNMTTADVPMSATATQKLKVKLGDTIYSVYDDSINPGE